MGEQLLHTPEGVRDIYGKECEKKIWIQNQLYHKMRQYGFRPIQTPGFEFFDIFNKERGTVPSREMYKFFDREGNTLVLRPDITPSIARCVAKYYKEERLPIRFCYEGNTYINNNSYQGKLKEITQIGGELIQDGSAEADAEIIALTISCLLESGLKEFQIEVGNVAFFTGLMEEAGFDKEETEQFKTLLEEKNLFGVQDFIAGKKVKSALKSLLEHLPEQFGKLESLKAKGMFQNRKSEQAWNRLEKIQEKIEIYGYSEYVTYDLGMLEKLDYYTGIIFRAYTYGLGEPIVSGGRYDGLVTQFGKEATAIGFAINTDLLMEALSRQKIELPLSNQGTLILYQEPFIDSAIRLAEQFRKETMEITLVKKEETISLEWYQNYAKRYQNGGILYLKAQGIIEVINLITGTQTVVEEKELIKH